MRNIPFESNSFVIVFNLIILLVLSTVTICLILIFWLNCFILAYSALWLIYPCNACLIQLQNVIAVITEKSEFLGLQMNLSRWYTRIEKKVFQKRDKSKWNFLILSEPDVAIY